MRTYIEEFIKCGVYFLFHGNQIVYVGQSTNIHMRVMGHYHERRKVFDSYEWIECPKENLNGMEIEMIVKHLPMYNIKEKPIKSKHLPDGDMPIPITTGYHLSVIDNSPLHQNGSFLKVKEVYLLKIEGRHFTTTEKEFTHNGVMVKIPDGVFGRIEIEGDTDKFHPDDYNYMAPEGFIELKPTDAIVTGDLIFDGDWKTVDKKVIGFYVISTGKRCIRKKN